jgi:hypothetical protein
MTISRILKLIVSAAVASSFFAASLQAKPKGFYIERLPKGNDVTLPMPATTYLPLAERAMFTSTDMPQTLSFKAINVSGGKASSIRVAIYDSKASKVHYADVKPGMPYLYNFRGINSITIIPGLANGSKQLKAYKNLKLQVESNKPLEIAH